MSLQKYFKNFNNKIKMDYEEKSELASKRDILLKKLRDSGQLPSFTELNQGSYSMYIDYFIFSSGYSRCKQLD